MKANELMIGDFIRRIYNQKIIKVREIKQSCIYTNDNGYEYNEIEPIPIIPEILEKNGFKKLSDGRFLLEDLEDNYWIKFYPKDTNYTCGAYDYIDLDCGCISIREMPIEFFHELQHALKLCGIEKEIVID